MNRDHVPTRGDRWRRARQALQV